jgi:integrase
VRLLILTMQRRQEVAEMDWSEIDLEAKTWILPPERAKNDEAYVVPLSPLALDQ